MVYQPGVLLDATTRVAISHAMSQPDKNRTFPVSESTEMFQSISC
jgi:hypothetical protein